MTKEKFGRRQNFQEPKIEFVAWESPSKALLHSKITLNATITYEAMNQYTMMGLREAQEVQHRSNLKEQNLGSHSNY